MREFTKTLGSLSLSMSMLGAQQVLNLLREPIPSPASAAGLNAVSGIAEQQLGSYLRDLQTAGDRVQRSTVDLVFGFATLEALDPNKLLLLSSEVLRDSTAAVRQLVSGTVSRSRTAEPAAPGEPCGWGPMPGVIRGQ